MLRCKLGLSVARSTIFGVGKSRSDVLRPYYIPFTVLVFLAAPVFARKFNSSTLYTHFQAQNPFQM